MAIRTAGPRAGAGALACAFLLAAGGVARAGGDEAYAEGRACFERRDHAGALEHWRAAAAEGSADAMEGLGQLHLGGWGVARDYDEALRWFHKAADLGHSQAMFMVGEMHYFGRGVPASLPEACRWYRKAAETGHGQAMVNVGFAAWSGLDGEPDYAEALRWYRKAAELGVPQAMTNLGVLYEKGQGVEQDYAEALSWHRKAAEHDHPHAMYNIGYFYENGLGVERDDEEAMRWYRRSAAREFPFSLHRLGLMTYDGRGADRNVGTALACFARAQSMRHDPETAMYLWFCCMEMGDPQGAAWFLTECRARLAGSAEHYQVKMLAFLAGDITEETLLADAADAGKGALAEARLCVGTARLITGDRARALELLRLCAAEETPRSPARLSARATLRRIRAAEDADAPEGD